MAQLNSIMKLIVALALGVSISIAAPPAEWNGDNTASASCKNMMKANGLTDRFPGVVAHAVHSLTLQDIRFYFEPLASDDLQVMPNLHEIT